MNSEGEGGPHRIKPEAMKKVTTWKQLLADPRVSEVWSEDTDGVDYWVALKPGYHSEGLSCIHEWSKKECITELNNVEEGEPY